MYKINHTLTANAITSLSKVDKSVRKVYNNLKNKEFASIPNTAEELLVAYTGRVEEALVACKSIVDVLHFTEVEEFSIPEIAISEDISDRFSFMKDTEVEDMTASELSLVLFKELGSEVEVQTLAMQTGSKVGLDMLHEFKELYFETNVGIQPELLEQEICQFMALAKIDKGSSMFVGVDGSLHLYSYLPAEDMSNAEAEGFNKAIAERIKGLDDISNFMFMLGNGVKALDIMVLQSAFKSYKEEVAQGNLPATGNAFNLAVVRLIKGAKPINKDSMKARMKKVRRLSI